MLSCLAGWLTAALIGDGQTASAVAVGAATLAMLATGTLHPPAGIDAFLIATRKLSFAWALSPVLAGALMLAGFAAIWRRCERHLVGALAAKSRARYERET